MFGLPLINGSTGFDNGEDIKYNDLVIAVKTMGRNCDVRPDFVNNLFGLQKEYNTDIYVFTSTNKITNVLTVCGWVDKKQFLEKASIFPEGSTRYRSDGTKFKTYAELYEINNQDLFQVSSIDDLKKQLDNYKSRKRTNPCEMCETKDNNGLRREDNIYLCFECNNKYPIEEKGIKNETA